MQPRDTGIVNPNRAAGSPSDIDRIAAKFKAEKKGFSIGGVKIDGASLTGARSTGRSMIIRAGVYTWLVTKAALNCRGLREQIGADFDVDAAQHFIPAIVDEFVNLRRQSMGQFLLIARAEARP